MSKHERIGFVENQVRVLEMAAAHTSVSTEELRGQQETLLTVARDQTELNDLVIGKMEEIVAETGKAFRRTVELIASQEGKIRELTAVVSVQNVWLKTMGELVNKRADRITSLEQRVAALEMRPAGPVLTDAAM